MTARFYYRDPHAPAPNRPRALGAVVFILSSDGSNVLMEHRADSDTVGFIGGSVDPGESVTAAAHREVREETGLTISELTFVGLNSDPTRIAAYPDGNVIATVTSMFVAGASTGDLRRSAESRALVWTAWSDIDRKKLPQLHEPLLDAVLQWRRDGLVRAY